MAKLGRSAPDRKAGLDRRAIAAMSQPMPKMRKKADLPVKICATCGRPMVWRKAWAKTWEAVRHCSDKCRLKAR